MRGLSRRLRRMNIRSGGGWKHHGGVGQAYGKGGGCVLSSGEKGTCHLRRDTVGGSAAVVGCDVSDI